MKKYFYLWFKITAQITQVAFASRVGVVFFILGKIIRFVVFIFFIFIITSKTSSLAGYTTWQVILFFLTFNLIDIISQFLWREVYRFRNYIISGSFDRVLIQPISPLFTVLFGGSDILDLITLVPLLGFMWFVLQEVQGITLFNFFIYTLLVINSLIIVLAFHIFVLALGVITTEVDNAIWILREITQFGRVPLEVYPSLFRFLFTYFVPVAAIVTFPTQALFGLLTFKAVIISFIFSSVFLSLSLLSWQKALKYYTSASS